MTKEVANTLAARLGELGLRKREVEVTMIVASGVPHRVTAERLFISIKTVKLHLTNTFRKLKISSRYELQSIVSELVSKIERGE